MPDFLSLLLCLTSIGLIWKHNRYTLPFLFATLGLLIKPTTVIVFLLFLTHENITKKVKHLFWFIPSVLVTLFYYTIAIKYIEKKQDIGTLFAINPRPILSSLKDFFSDFSSLADNLNYHAFVPYIFCTFLILSLYIYWKEKTFPFLKLWIIAALQIFIIAALDGKHSYIHYYYFIGVAPTFTLIALGLWHKTGKLPLSIGWILKLIFIALFLGRLFDIIHFDLRGFKETPDGGSPFFQCQELMKAHPEFPWHQGFVFRSPAENFPALGLCFGEREGSQKSDFGFIYTNNNIPKNCQIQDKRSSVALIKCS